MPENTVGNRALGRRQVQYLLSVIQDELGLLSAAHLLLVKSMLWNAIRNLGTFRFMREIEEGIRSPDDYPDWGIALHHEWLQEVQDGMSKALQDKED